jgi:D-aminoacyl-tRNA deacylase
VDALAETVIKLLETKVPSEDYEYYVGFGGPHYAPEFTKVMLRTEVAVGHIAPGYVFPMGVKNETILESFEKVVEKPCKALIQWKGVKNPFRQNLVEFLKEKGIEVVRLDKIKK